MPSIIFNTNRDHLDIVAKGKYLPTLKEFLSITLTFCLTVFAWIFFRANDIHHALSYVSHLFTLSFFSMPEIFPVTRLALILAFMMVEWLGREQQYAIARLGIIWSRPVMWSVYLSIAIIIFLYQGKEQAFIYFQF